MKVFISWSGSYGKGFAEILRNWLPSVLQAVKPFFSANDIAHGARWAAEVGTELEAANVGIVILTKDSITAPWLMFEAGALSKHVGRSKVVPLLLDLEPSEVVGPLVQFQCSTVEEGNLKRLLRMLNSELGDKALSDSVLESVFAKWWPELRDAFASLPRMHSVQSRPKALDDRTLLLEVLAVTRNILDLQPSPSVPTLPQSHRTNLFSSEIKGTLSLAEVRKRLADGGNLAGANLKDLNLSHQDLTGANLRGASLVGANLSQAVLTSANMDAANLEQAVLDGADLQGTILSRSNLWKASFRNVRNLSKIGSLEQANLYGALDLTLPAELAEKYETHRSKDYGDFLDHFRKMGLDRKELRDAFLWMSHTYPGPEALRSTFSFVDKDA
jgi:hypothetical protein